MKISLRSQLIYGFTIVFSLLILGFSYMSISNQSDFLHEKVHTQLENRSTAIATSSKVWIMSNDYVGLQEVLENFSVYKNIVFVAIINMDGKVIAHTDKSLIGKYISDNVRISYLQKALQPTTNHSQEEKILLETKENMDIARIIHNEDLHLGFVHLRINQNEYQENLKNTIFQALTFALFSILLGITIAYLLSNIFTKELLRLADTMKRYRTGNKDIKADEDVVPEISKLAHEFNDLVKTINHSQDLILQLNERQKLALYATNDGIWDWNLVTDKIYFSPRWKEILGYSDDEISNEMDEWTSRVHPDDLEKTLIKIQNNIDGKTEFYQDTYRLKHKDGHWVWTLDRGKTLFENTKAIRMLGTQTDITKDKKQQLKYAKQALIIQQINDSVISTDLQGKILSWNKGSELMLGYTLEEMLTRYIFTIYETKDKTFYENYMQKLIDTDSYSVDTHLVTKEKKIIPVMISMSILKDNNKAVGVIYIIQDISQRKQAEEDLHKQKQILEHQAHHDALTGLANRFLLSKKLDHALTKAKRHSLKIALLFIDLDRFKEINDSLGHGVGDKVLKSVTQKLSNVIRSEDTLARLGGDEFVIMLENISHGRDAAKLGQKIIDILSHPLIIEENTLYISSSIGISLYPDDGDNSVDLLKYADSAMYKAKDEGRNNFQFYNAHMTKLAVQRIEIETALRKALTNEDFLVYYQPQVNALENKLIGMEALVRWQHPTMGLLSPANFIPIAEATGLIVDLDRIVMKIAIKQLTQWYKNGLNPGVLAINLTVKQIQQLDFIDVLKSILEETNCKAEWLELEVTESQIMKNPKEAIKTLNEISALGIELAIDDFGTGYSSLSYLKKLPLNKLKIDQSFVKDLPHNEHDVGISKTVIALAKSLNLSIIAEGVETQEQKDFLLENGCVNIQGYYYSKPIPAHEMESILLHGFKN